MTWKSDFLGVSLLRIQLKVYVRSSSDSVIKALSPLPRDMPAQARALVERMRNTPVSTDTPPKGALLFNWAVTGLMDPSVALTACLRLVFKGVHRSAAWQGLAAGGQGGIGSWPRSQALGPLSQSWLLRALLHKHRVLKIG